MRPESRDLVKSWEVSDNISEMMQDKDVVAWKANRNRMWPIEWHHCQCP